MRLADNFFSGNAKANTSDIQEAINYLSYSNDRILDLPSGLIPFERLFCYHDPILNPGFNPNGKQGMITIRGSGSLDIGYAKTKNYTLGTMLKSNITSSDPPISFGNSSLGHNTNPFKPRRSRLQDISIIANNPGYVVEAVGNPEIDWERVFIIQEHENGNGVNTGSFWFGSMSKVFIINNSPLTKTGDAFSFLNGTSGGLFNFDRGLVDGFNNGFNHLPGSFFFSNLNVTQSGIQNCFVGFNNQSRLISLNFTGTHFEGCDTDILTSADVDILTLHKIYVSGRNGKSNANIKLNGGARVLDIRDICLRDGQSDYVELSKTTSSIDSFVDVFGVNYFHDSSGTMKKPVITITNNGNGKCRLKVNSHNYLSGRKVILNGTPYDGEWVVTVIDSNYIDLDNSTFSASYSGGGTCSLLCHAIKNVGNIPLSNINVKGMVCTDHGVNFVRGIY